MSRQINRKLKKAVKERREATGENYTTALRHVLAAQQNPECEAKPTSPAIRALVTVTAPTIDLADQVMANRFGADEDYGFPYLIEGWERAGDGAYAVTISGCDEAQATQVLDERVSVDEDYGFEYTISVTGDRPHQQGGDVAATLDRIAAEALASGDQAILDLVEDLSEQLGLDEAAQEADSGLTEDAVSDDEDGRWIDYHDTAQVLDLVQVRGDHTVPDRQAALDEIGRYLEEEDACPGWYDTWDDRDEHGAAWDKGGGPWADRLEDHLVAKGLLT